MGDPRSKIVLVLDVEQALIVSWAIEEYVKRQGVGYAVADVVLTSLGLAADIAGHDLEIRS